MTAVVRSGNVAAKSRHIGPPSETPSNAARSEPPRPSPRGRRPYAARASAAARRHAVGDAGAALVEEDQPRERREVCEEGGDVRLLPEDSMCETQPGTKTRSTRSVADDLVGDAAHRRSSRSASPAARGDSPPAVRNRKSLRPPRGVADGQADPDLCPFSAARRRPTPCSRGALMAPKRQLGRTGCPCFRSCLRA